MPQCAGPNNLAAFLREHGGLEGLAKLLGEHDPSAEIVESEANDNRPPKRVGLLRLLWARFCRRDSQETTPRKLASAATFALAFGRPTRAAYQALAAALSRPKLIK
jgi:hypothetical protein